MNARNVSSIRELHLIHHSHTDFGFTDLESTTWKLHVDYIRQALGHAEATQHDAYESQFRWTCEVTMAVEQFLAEATPEERKSFDRAVERGQIEVASMPFNGLFMMSRAEWNDTQRRLQPIRGKYGSTTAMQNDVNGFPWGLIPGLIDEGVNLVWMGCNSDTSLPLTDTPSAWWWQGPDGRRILVWSSQHYCSGYYLFHRHEWRRGVVPSAGDVWFNPPSAGETWDPSPTNLAVAKELLDENLPRATAHYPYQTIAFQVTNMWRMDNDPPSGHICDFVRAWNAAGHTPRLILSTPKIFAESLRKELGDSLPVRRGDWQDWWADGILSTPEALGANQAAKRLLDDLHLFCSANRIAENAQSQSWARDAWRNATLFDEHTFGSISGVAMPYEASTLGGHAEKVSHAYRALEHARMARALVLRSHESYVSSSRTCRFLAVNPGSSDRAGWVSLPAMALGDNINAVRDLETGRVYPLESIDGPVWSDPDLSRAPFDTPNDVWGWKTVQKRFFHPGLAASASRKFECLSVDPASIKPEPAATAFKVSHDARGLIQLVEASTGKTLTDPTSPWGMGQVIVETLRNPGQRYVLSRRDTQKLADQWLIEPVTLVSQVQSNELYSSRLTSVWQHRHLERVEQCWDIFQEIPRAVVTTTLWLREMTAPCAVYLAFPFAMKRAKIHYRSVGYDTIFSDENIEGSCAETLCHQDGVIISDRDSDGVSIKLATPDTPLGCPGGVRLRRAITAPVTDLSGTYCIPAVCNYWHTNFAIIKAGKLVMRHWIELCDDRPIASQNASISDELWCYPCH